MNKYTKLMAILFIAIFTSIYKVNAMPTFGQYPIGGPNTYAPANIDTPKYDEEGKCVSEGIYLVIAFDILDFTRKPPFTYSQFQSQEYGYQYTQVSGSSYGTYSFTKPLGHRSDAINVGTGNENVNMFYGIEGKYSSANMKDVKFLEYTNNLTDADFDNLYVPMLGPVHPKFNTITAADYKRYSLSPSSYKYSTNCTEDQCDVCVGGPLVQKTGANGFYIPTCTEYIPGQPVKTRTGETYASGYGNKFSSSDSSSFKGNYIFLPHKYHIQVIWKEEAKLCEPVTCEENLADLSGGYSVGTIKNDFGDYEYYAGVGDGYNYGKPYVLNNDFTQIIDEITGKTETIKSGTCVSDAVYLGIRYNDLVKLNTNMGAGSWTFNMQQSQTDGRGAPKNPYLTDSRFQQDLYYKQIGQALFQIKDFSLPWSKYSPTNISIIGHTNIIHDKDWNNVPKRLIGSNQGGLNTDVSNATKEDYRKYNLNPGSYTYDTTKGSYLGFRNTGNNFYVSVDTIYKKGPFADFDGKGICDPTVGYNKADNHFKYTMTNDVKTWNNSWFNNTFKGIVDCKDEYCRDSWRLMFAAYKFQLMLVWPDEVCNPPVKLTCDEIATRLKDSDPTNNPSTSQISEANCCDPADPNSYFEDPTVCPGGSDNRPTCDPSDPSCNKVPNCDDPNRDPSLECPGKDDPRDTTYDLFCAYDIQDSLYSDQYSAYVDYYVGSYRIDDFKKDNGDSSGKMDDGSNSNLYYKYRNDISLQQKYSSFSTYYEAYKDTNVSKTSNEVCSVQCFNRSSAFVSNLSRRTNPGQILEISNQPIQFYSDVFCKSTYIENPAMEKSERELDKLKADLAYDKCKDNAQKNGESASEVCEGPKKEAEKAKEILKEFTEDEKYCDTWKGDFSVDGKLKVAIEKADAGVDGPFYQYEYVDVIQKSKSSDNNRVGVTDDGNGEASIIFDNNVEVKSNSYLDTYKKYIPKGADKGEYLSIQVDAIIPSIEGVPAYSDLPSCAGSDYLGKRCKMSASGNIIEVTYVSTSSYGSGTAISTDKKSYNWVWSQKVTGSIRFPDYMVTEKKTGKLITGAETFAKDLYVHIGYYHVMDMNSIPGKYDISIVSGSIGTKYTANTKTGVTTKSTMNDITMACDYWVSDDGVTPECKEGEDCEDPDCIVGYDPECSECVGPDCDKYCWPNCPTEVDCKTDPTQPGCKGKEIEYCWPWCDTPVTPKIPETDPSCDPSGSGDPDCPAPITPSGPGENPFWPEFPIPPFEPPYEPTPNRVETFITRVVDPTNLFPNNRNAGKNWAYAYDKDAGMPLVKSVQTSDVYKDDHILYEINLNRSTMNNIKTINREIYGNNYQSFDRFTFDAESNDLNEVVSGSSDFLRNLGNDVFKRYDDNILKYGFKRYNRKY